MLITLLLNELSKISWPYSSFILKPIYVQSKIGHRVNIVTADMPSQGSISRMSSDSVSPPVRPCTIYMLVLAIVTFLSC